MPLIVVFCFQFPSNYLFGTMIMTSATSLEIQAFTLAFQIVLKVLILLNYGKYNLAEPNSPLFIAITVIKI